MQVKLWIRVLEVIVIFPNPQVLEDLVDLLDEIGAENGFAEPELLVLLKDQIMHIVRDLWLVNNLIAQFTRLIRLLKLCFAEIYCFDVVHDIVELLLVVLLDPVVNKDVGVLLLDQRVPVGLDDSWVLPGVLRLELVGKMFRNHLVVSTIAFFGDE